MVSGNNKIWAADLADMRAFAKYNDGNNYLLLVIDTFNKYGWVVPLKDKKGETMVNAFKTIFEKGRTPEKLWTDKGREFYNKDMDDLRKLYDIELYSTEKRGKK